MVAVDVGVGVVVEVGVWVAVGEGVLVEVIGAVSVEMGVDVAPYGLQADSGMLRMIIGYHFKKIRCILLILGIAYLALLNQLLQCSKKLRSVFLPHNL